MERRTNIVMFFSLAFLIATSGFTAAGHDVTSLSYGPTSYSLKDPIVASNGETFLTLWTSEAGKAGTFIYGSVADGHGHPLFRAAFRLQPFPATLIDLTAAGSDYLMVWRSSSGVHTSIVSGQGVIIREGPAIVVPTSDFARVNGNGSSILLTYHSSGPLSWPTETLAQVISAGGPLIGKPVFLGNQTLQAATPYGSDFVTVTTERGGMYFLRLDGHGRVLVPKKLIGVTPALQNVVTATNGSEILIATLGLVVAVSGDGTVLSSRSFEPEPGTENSLVWTGNSYLHIRRKGWTAVAQHLDRLGNPLDAPVAIEASLSSAATANGIVYTAGRTEHQGIAGFILDGTGAGSNMQAIDGGEILSIVPAVQTAPVMASDGVGFMTGWTGEMAESHSFVATRLSVGATALDAQPIDFGTVLAPSSPRNPTVPSIAHHGIACAGMTCLAIWEDDTFTIHGRWVIAGNGAQESFVIGRGGITDQPVAWNGTDFLVAWTSGELYCATVSLSGVVSPRIQITRGSSGDHGVEVAWDGHRYLMISVFNARDCDCWFYVTGISLYAVATDGTLLAQSGFATSLFNAHLTASDHDFLLIYDQNPSESPFYEVTARHATVIGSTLQIDPPMTLFRWIGPTSSSAAWDGREYVAAWQYGIDATWWVTSARLMASNYPNYPDRRASASGVPDRQVKPAIAANAAGECLVATSESPVPGEPARLRAYAEREMEPLPPSPSAPFGVYSEGSTVHWQSDGRNVEGFVVERFFPEQKLGTVVGTARAGDRSAVVATTQSIRVRAFNAAGISEPSPAAIITDPRRRSVRR